MRPIITDFGTFHLFGTEITPRIYGYGLMLVLGFLLAVFIAQWRARRAGEDPEHVSRCGILALIGGVVGARLAYVIENPAQFFSRGDADFAAMANITSGGLIYYGGVVLATLLVLGYLLVKKLPVRRFLDIVAVSMMIGLAFGRAGCFLNGCCYGGRADRDWPLAMEFPMYAPPLLNFADGDNPYSEGTTRPTPPYADQMTRGQIRPDPALVDEEGRLIPPSQFNDRQIAIAQASHSHPVKPAQLLGLINAMLIAGVLWAFYRLRTREGQVFGLLIVLYPITRFVLESIRADNPHNLAQLVLTHNQKTSLATIVAGVIFLVVLKFRPASAGPVLAERANVDAQPAGSSRSGRVGRR